MKCAPWIQTYTGRAFDFRIINQDSVEILDIAHSLAQQCRYTGHCDQFYSIAQHCVVVSHLVPCNYALEGLLHDAHEAYIGDMSTPLKDFLNCHEYESLARRIDDALCLKYGAKFHECRAAVKQADMVALSTEVRDLLKDHPRDWIPMPAPMVEVIEPMYPEVAEFVFMERFLELWEKRDVQ